LTLFKPWAEIDGKDSLSWKEFKVFIRRCAAPTATYRQRAILQTILRMLGGMRISSRKKRLLNKWRVRGVVPWNLLEAQEKMRSYEREECRRKGISGIPDECAYQKCSHDGSRDQSESFFNNPENGTEDDGMDFARDVILRAAAVNADGGEEDKAKRDNDKLDIQTAFAKATIDSMTTIMKDVLEGLKEQGKHHSIVNPQQVIQAHQDLQLISKLGVANIKVHYKTMKKELSDDFQPPDVETKSDSNVFESFESLECRACTCEEGDEPADEPNWKRDEKIWPILNDQQEMIAREIYNHARAKLNHELHPSKHLLPRQKLIMIKGGPGTGKTTLMKEVQRRVTSYACRMSHPQV